MNYFIYTSHQKYVSWTLYPGSGKSGPYPAFPLLFHENPASRVSVLAIPNIVFFPNPAYVPKKGKQSRFSGSSQIPYAVNVSRIPPCILTKSPILIIPFQTLYIRNFRTPEESFYLCAINLHRQRPPSISASKVAHVTVNRDFLRTKLQRVHLAFGRTTDLQKRKFVLI